MSKTPDRLANQTEETEDFYSRWSKRKIQSQSQPLAEKQITAKEPETDKPEPSLEKVVLCDQDMPDLNSLNEESDYSCFLSPGVSDTLRQQALRKLFGGSGFNICDGLDDYDEEYTSFEKLGDIVTADMRYRLEQEAKQKIQLATENENFTEDNVTANDEDNVTGHDNVDHLTPELSESPLADSSVQSIPVNSVDRDMNENFSDIETNVTENEKLS